MNILRVSMVMLFITTLSSVALADQDNEKQKDGTKRTVSEPDCDNKAAPEYL